MSKRRNTFSRAIRQLKSEEIDNKIQLTETLPTNNTMGVFISMPPGAVVSTVTVQREVGGLLDLDFDADGESDGTDTTGLFETDGTPSTAMPPNGDTSYILGPMSAMYYSWWSGGTTTIGYIRQSDRKMVNLGTISGTLDQWDGSTVNSYGQLTLEHAVWFRDVKKKDNAGNHPSAANYRAFYPGPPSNSPDANGRYLCTITGQAKDTTVTQNVEVPHSPTEKGAMSADDNFSAIMDKINKGQKLTEAEKQWLRDNGLGDFADGGDTASPIGDLIGLGLSLVAAKALVAAFGALGPVVGNAMKNAFKSDWGNRTLSDAAYQRFLQTGQMPPGIQGWRPFKAFTTKMLQTGPTVEASAALTTLILQFLGGSEKKNPKDPMGIQQHSSTSVNGFNTQSSSQGTTVNWGNNMGSAVIVAGNYGNLKGWEQEILQNGLKVRSGSSYERELRRLKNMYPGFVPQASVGGNTHVAHYNPQGQVLSESKRRVLKNLKKPVVLPEGKKKTYKVKPGARMRGMDKLVGDIKPQQSYKEPQKIWSKNSQGYNERTSQEKKNQVLQYVGASMDHWDYMTDTVKKQGGKIMSNYKDHDYLYDYWLGGTRKKAVRKEEVKGDYVIFLDDKSSILQSSYNEKVEQEKEKEMFDEYYKLNPKNEPIPYENDPLFKRVTKRLKPVIDYPDKPAKKGYPNEPPPKMVNGWHPEYGKRYKYDKLDPVSARAMPPTGDPEIDANVEKTKVKPK